MDERLEDGNASVFQRHPIASKIFVAVATCASMVLVGEVGLRVAGFTAAASHYRSVDKLVVYDRYITDETGILRLNPGFDFSSESKSISVNESGFRDASFQEQLESSKPTIMLVGDSFTYGSGADPITRSFADVIEEHGYTAFNFGIPAVGHRQYAAIVQRYLDSVKPDLLAIMVFLGNDLNQFPQKLSPHKLTWYDSNAGMLYAYDAQGNHLTPAETYKQNYSTTYAKLEYYARKSVLAYTIGLRCISLRNQIRSWQYEWDLEADDLNEYARESFLQIQEAADSSGTPCCFFAIPVKPSRRHEKNTYESVEYVFEGLDTVYVEFSEEEFAANPNDPHFNNKGHAKMARIVIEAFEDRVSAADKPAA